MRRPWIDGANKWRISAVAAILVGALPAHADPAPAGAVAEALAPPTKAVSSLATILGIRVGGGAGRSRMVIDLDRAVTCRKERPQAARRLTLRLSDVASPAETEGEGLGLIRSWRIEDAAGAERLVLDLGRGARLASRFLVPPGIGVAHWRYVIDVVQDGAAPSDARAEAVGQVSVAPPAVVRRAAGRWVIVIDPGHGGHDPGARGVGVNEKDINLAAAFALRDRLRREDRFRVVLTRDDDTYVPLDGRVRVAREARADLFISLHADSAGADPATHGASVYTLSDHGVDRVDEVLGPSDGFGASVARRPDRGVGEILLDLTQRSTLNRSAAFAGLLIDRIGRDIDLLPRTHRDAGYFVLLAPDVPAVLLEMGFITSPMDEARLDDPVARTRLAEAIGGAVDAYFDGLALAPAAKPASGVAGASGSWRESPPIRPG